MRNQSSPSPLSITARQTPHAGGLQLLYGFTKQERKEESMDSLLFFLLISFGDFNKAHFNRAYLCDKHTYFNMPLTININQKIKNIRVPRSHRIISKGTLPQETALCLWNQQLGWPSAGCGRPLQDTGFTTHHCHPQQLTKAGNHFLLKPHLRNCTGKHLVPNDMNSKRT